MYTIIYSSGIEPYLGDIDISSLLYAARQRNAEHKITGILLHFNGKFIQVLEGEESTVKKLYENISSDRRHKNLKVIFEKEIDKRQFDGWNMGFKNISEKELEENPILKSFIDDQVSADSGEMYNFLAGLNADKECCEAFY
jgi:Sensors of blue-light using FAD